MTLEDDATVTVPAARILRRMAFSGGWAIVAIVPWANVLALWIIAFIRWARDAGDDAGAGREARSAGSS